VCVCGGGEAKGEGTSFIVYVRHEGFCEAASGTASWTALRAQWGNHLECVRQLPQPMMSEGL
jgi:hypothetical protein